MFGERAEPFEHLFGERPNETLTLALHESSLSNLSRDEEYIVRECTQNAADWGLRVFAVGDAPGSDLAVPRAMITRHEGIDGAYASVAWNATEESGTSLVRAAAIESWAEMALPVSSRSAAVQTEVAQGLGASVFVTRDNNLLRHRDDPMLREQNLLTPLELGPLMGVWARSTKAGGHFAHHVVQPPFGGWAIPFHRIPSATTSQGARRQRSSTSSILVAR